MVFNKENWLTSSEKRGQEARVNDKKVHDRCDVVLREDEMIYLNKFFDHVNKKKVRLYCIIYLAFEL